MASSLTHRSSYAQLLRRPGYPSFVVTVSLTRVSGTMFNIAGVLLVLQRTGSAPLAGVTAAAAVLPGALSAPLLGAWLDVSKSRRALIAVDQLLSVAGLIAILLLAGHAPDWTVPAVAVGYSVTRPFSTGSFFSALAELAGQELLDHASAIEATSLNLSFVVGPALAGALAGATSPSTAINVQIALTVLATALIVINPAFEARPAEHAGDLRTAVRTGIAAIRHNAILRSTGAASMFAAAGWGLMVVGFPLYAARTLHAGAHASGYLWAGVAGGSAIGTFVLRGESARRRIGLSYAVLGVSALLWPLVHSIVLGVALTTLTGFLEGPAYAGTIALRQRHTPPAVRAQVMTTLTGAAGLAVSVGSAAGGALHSVIGGVLAFTAINAAAALTSWGGFSPPRSAPGGEPASERATGS